MANGDNKCAACGQWSGRGHKCPTTNTPVAPASAPATPGTSSAGGDREAVNSRVEAARNHLSTPAEPDTGRLTGGLWGVIKNRRQRTRYLISDAGNAKQYVEIETHHDQYTKSLKTIAEVVNVEEAEPGYFIESRIYGRNEPPRIMLANEPIGRYSDNRLGQLHVETVEKFERGEFQHPKSVELFNIAKDPQNNWFEE